jgi:hypothetical protein
MQHAIPLIGLVAAVAFAFGERAAQVLVGLVLLIGAAGAIALAVLVVLRGTGVI